MRTNSRHFSIHISTKLISIDEEKIAKFFLRQRKKNIGYFFLKKIANFFLAIFWLSKKKYWLFFFFLNRQFFFLRQISCPCHCPLNFLTLINFMEVEMRLTNLCELFLIK